MRAYNESTIKALWGSVEKWFHIWEGTIQDLGCTNCPLCNLFVDNGCKGCPVSNHTGKTSCYNTPYYDFRSACNRNNNYREWAYFARTDQERQLAQAMYAYLVDLALSVTIEF